MVIERAKDGDFTAIGDRFRLSGRMMPEVVIYHASWIDAPKSRCFQIMEAPDRESLNPWIGAWDDLVDFEVIRSKRVPSSGPRFKSSRTTSQKHRDCFR